MSFETALGLCSCGPGGLAFGALGARERIQGSDRGVAPGAGAAFVAVQPFKLGCELGWNRSLAVTTIRVVASARRRTPSGTQVAPPLPSTTPGSMPIKTQ